MIDRNGEPWFVAADACKALGMDLSKGTSKWLVSLDEDEVQSPEILGATLSGPGRRALLVNESGLYSLILRSRKPEARAFKKWVTSEVLPTIRKTGGYMAPSVANLAETDPEQFLARAVLIAQRLRLSGAQGCAWPYQVRRRMSGTSPCRTGHPRTAPRARSSTQRTV